MSVAFHHCTTPPLVLLHVVACPGQSLSVYTFTNFEGVMISINLFALGALSSISQYASDSSRHSRIGHVIFLAVSFHAVHDVCSFPAHVQQFSHNCSVHCSSFTFQLNERFCRWRPLYTWSHHGFATSKPRTCITFRMYFGFASTEYPSCRLHNHSRQEINFVTLSSSCDPHRKLALTRVQPVFRTSFFGPNINPSSTRTKIFAFVSSFRKQLGSVRKWVIVQTFQDT